MGNLAFVGAHAINGVSALHTELMRKTVFHDLAQALSRTASTTRPTASRPRRWLMPVQPGADRAHRRRHRRPTSSTTPKRLRDLEPVRRATRRSSERFAAARAARTRMALARLIRERIGVRVDPDALFDVQVKRIHEYKRQLLNIIETVALYDAIRAPAELDWVPRVKIFAGKAAPSYQQAKLIIKLANDVARVVNDDPSVRGMLKVVFLPNYNVSLAEVIIPAADSPSRFPPPGMEASGTGNMKFALNGALTHRHARRRQRRDPRAGRRRQHLHLRADRRGGRRAARRRPSTPRRGDRGVAGAHQALTRSRSKRASSRRTIASATAASSTPVRPRLVHGLRRLRRLCRYAQRQRRRAVARSRRHGGARRS